MGSKDEREKGRVVPLSVVIDEQLAPDPTTVFSREVDPKVRARIRRRMERMRDGKGKLAKDPEHGGIAFRVVERDGVIDDTPLPPTGKSVRLGLQKGDHADRARQIRVFGPKQTPNERQQAEDGEEFREFLQAFAQERSDGVDGEVHEQEAVTDSARGTEHASLAELMGESLRMEDGLLDLWSAFGDRISRLGESTTEDVDRSLFRISPILDNDGQVIALAAITDKPDNPLVIKSHNPDVNFRLSYCETGDCEWPTPIEPVAPYSFSTHDIRRAMQDAEEPNLFAHLVDAF